MPIDDRACDLGHGEQSDSALRVCEDFCISKLTQLSEDFCEETARRTASASRRDCMKRGGRCEEDQSNEEIEGLGHGLRSDSAIRVCRDFCISKLT